MISEDQVKYLRMYNRDITENDSGLILHGCNCQGGFGSGVAGAIREAWPAVYEAFVENGTGAELLGTFQPVQLTDDLVVGNCYTQEFYGSDGKRYASPEAIQSALEAAFGYAAEHDLVIKTSMIGTGLGGLRVSEFMDILNELYENNDVSVEIYHI